MSAIYNLCNGAIGVCELINLYHASANHGMRRIEGNIIINAQDKKTYYATIISRIAIVALQGAEIYCSNKGYKTTTLKEIKQMQILPKLIDLGIQVYPEYKEKGYGLFFEKKLLNPMTSLAITLLQADYYQEKEYLEMDPQEREKHFRREPGYDGEPDIYKPILVEECMQNIKDSTILLSYLTIIRSLAEMNTLYTQLKITSKRDQELIDRLLAHKVLVDGTRLESYLNGSEEIIEAIDLLRLNYIPEEIADDPFFSNHTCMITHSPIRFALGVRNSNGSVTSFERDAILTWLSNNDLHPFDSNMRVSTSQLIDMPALQTQIDARLTQYQTRLKAYFKQIGAE